MKRSGYTLPVFAIAAARAAILTLQGKSCIEVTLDLWEAVTGTIAIAQSARIDERTALAITTSDPGDNLDLTAGTPIWAWVQIQDWQGQPLVLEGGEGIGHSADGAPAIYSLARKLADANLLPLMSQDRTMATSTVVVRFVLPEGRSLAERTSNAAFGILEGLSLLGQAQFLSRFPSKRNWRIFVPSCNAKLQRTSTWHFISARSGSRWRNEQDLLKPRPYRRPTGWASCW